MNLPLMRREKSLNFSNNQTKEMKYENEIINWAEDKGLFEGSTPVKQNEKTLEEVIETRDALVQMEYANSLGYDSKIIQREIEDGIGDTIVTLIILARMTGTDIESCLALAWAEIENRTGRIIGGKFVKDADLKTDSYDENGAVVEGGAE